MSNPKRRDILTASAIAGAVTLAGCTDGDDPNGSGNGDGNGGGNGGGNGDGNGNGDPNGGGSGDPNGYGDSPYGDGPYGGPLRPYEEPETRAQLIEVEVLANANYWRGAQEGVAPMWMHPDLDTVARDHTADMVERGFFDHENPDGEGFSERMDAADASCGNSGEVIAWRSHRDDEEPDEIAANIVEQWVESSGHYEIMTDGAMSRAGVGVAVVADDAESDHAGRVVATMVCGADCDDPVR